MSSRRFGLRSWIEENGSRARIRELYQTGWRIEAWSVNKMNVAAIAPIGYPWQFSDPEDDFVLCLQQRLREPYRNGKGAYRAWWPAGKPLPVIQGHFESLVPKSDVMTGACCDFYMP